ncbi:hypothetical protein B566_EDAN009594 [Ephemera danica]|nr:hypothetical protein B566_EDAN009594 [Ephemera danica]
MAAFLSTPELRFYNSSNLNSLRSSSISLRNLRRHKNSARMTLSSLQLNVPDNKIMRVNSMDSRQFRRLTNCNYWKKHTKSSELTSSSSKCKTKLIPDILISDYSTSNLRDNSKSHSMAMEHSYSVDPEEHSPLPRITQKLEPCIQNNYESIINSADSKDSISDFDTVEQQMQNSVALSTSNSASIEQDTPYFSDPEKQFLTFEDSEKPKSKFIPNGKIESKGRNTFDANLENLNEVKANFKSKEHSTRNIVNGMKVPVYFTSMKDLSQHLLSQNKTHLVRTGSLQILPFINIDSIKNCSNTSPKSENIHLKINVELQPISRFHRFLAALLCFFNVIPMMQRLERFVRWLFKLPPRSGTSFKSVGLCDASTASAEEFERKNNDVVRKKSGEDERLINTCRMPKLFQFTPSRSIFWRTR